MLSFQVFVTAEIFQWGCIWVQVFLPVYDVFTPFFKSIPTPIHLGKLLIVIMLFGSPPGVNIGPTWRYSFFSLKLAEPYAIN